MPGYRKQRHNSAAYRSGLEEINAEFLKTQGIRYEYEGFRIPFIQPVKPRTYTPDFLLENGIIVETKGEFVAADRQKHLLVKEQEPNLDIRFVFQNPNAKIYKGSKTTQAQWAEKHGFKWAKKLIPADWWTEPINEKSFRRIVELRREQWAIKS